MMFLILLLITFFLLSFSFQQPPPEGQMAILPHVTGDGGINSGKR